MGLLAWPSPGSQSESLGVHTLRQRLSSARTLLHMACAVPMALAAACTVSSTGATDGHEPIEVAQQPMTSGTGFGSLLRIDGEYAGDRFGEYMSGVGDVNGDGFDDLAVGAAYWWDRSGPPPAGAYGRVLVFFGSPRGLSSTRYQSISGQVDFDRRADVRRAGDVNGDGYADVLIQGALDYQETGLYLYLGGPLGLNPNPVWHIPFEPLYPRAFGGVGDLDGDGRSEVLVAVREWTVAWENRVYIYGGTADGLTPTPIWRYQDATILPGAESGVGVGDFTGDGYWDVIVGRSWCNPKAPEVNLLGFWGSATGLSTVPNWSIADTDCSYIGRELENVGDINGDGFADLVTSSESNARVGFDGAARAFLGGTTPSTTAAWSKSFPENNNGWIDAAGMGDVLGDGFNDIAIGLDYFFNPHNGKNGEEYPPIGRARLYPGSSAGLAVSEAWWAYDEAFNNNDFAGTVVGAGDLNGDGFPDIAIADYFIGIDYDHRRTGFVYVYYGTTGPEPAGRVLWDLAAYEVGSPTKLVDGARLESPTSFEVDCTGLGTQGRTRVKLEVEVKPAGVAFDGTGLMQGNTWVDTGIHGNRLSLTIPSLRSNTKYSFRARLVYRPDSPHITRHTRWFAGATVVTACDGTEPDLDGDKSCDDEDLDDDGDGIIDTSDCAPRANSIYPGATEVPNDGIDQDCNGRDTVTCFRDNDLDGYGGSTETLAEASCATAGLSGRTGDCNDTSATVFPGAVEVANDGVDQDCDGQDSVVCYWDNDGDSFGAARTLTAQDRCPSSGLVELAGDCNDSAKTVHPGATETADDGIDQDCSGQDSVSCYQDGDGDGFGIGRSMLREGACNGAGVAPKTGDCNDTDRAVHPGASETPGDGIDSNCDGSDPPIIDAGSVASADAERDAAIADGGHGSSDSDGGVDAERDGGGATTVSPPERDAGWSSAGGHTSPPDADTDDACSCRTSSPKRIPWLHILAGFAFVLWRRSLVGQRPKRTTQRT